MSKTWLTILSVGVGGMLALFPAAASDADKKPAEYSFRLIQKTTSPDGRFALAWGFARKNVDWSKYRDGEDEAGQPKYAVSSGEVEKLVEDGPGDFLVDVKKRRVVHEIDGMHLSDEPFHPPWSCRAEWSPDSRLLIQLNHIRSRDLYVCDVYWRGGSDAFAGPFHLGEVAKKAAYAALRKSGSEAYRRQGENFETSVDEISVNNLGQIAMTLNGAVRGTDDVFTAHLNLSVSRDRAGKIHAKVTKVRLEP